MMPNQPDIDQEALRARFNPDGSLLRQQQQRMLELLIEVDRICKKHHITYWLSCGTLLGAARHKGFIPWDDDLDIEMLLPDYKRLLKVLPETSAEFSLLCVSARMGLRIMPNLHSTRLSLHRWTGALERPRERHTQ